MVLSGLQHRKDSIPCLVQRHDIDGHAEDGNTRKHRMQYTGSMRTLPLLIGIVILLAGCTQPQAPQSPLQPITATGATASGDTTDTELETMPKTTDSLEVDVTPRAPTEIRTGSSGIIMGNAQSKLTLVMYDDYACFYCREFGLSDMSWLQDTYVAQQKLQIERVFVADSAAGILMAKVALCSEKQGLFIEADTRLHTKPLTTESELPTFAKSLQLNLKKLQACMNSTSISASLNAASSRAQNANITRFPAFELGTDSWLGVLTREDLKKKIINAL